MSLYGDERAREAWHEFTQAVWAERLSLFIWLGAVWVLLLVLFVAFRLL